MTVVLLMVALVLVLCVLSEKFSDRFGMPALILFLFVGMLFGSDGLFKIPFDDYTSAENICSIALMFIMFYGGVNTKWSSARQVTIPSLLMSTLGVVITAGITAALCHWLLHFSFSESFLIGAVLSSTDAASVFSILRKKKLNLKGGLASLLEVESGSNDPVAYMLTLVGIGLMQTGAGTQIIGQMALLVILQLVVGVLAGLVFATIAILLMTKTKLIAEGVDTIFLIAMVLICYGVSTLLQGNAFLSVYLMGILVGNHPQVAHKKSVIPFFDGVTGLAQILIFFLLGLLTFPHRMPAVMPVALAITAFIVLIARPIAVFVLLRPLKINLRSCLLVSWAGIRGAASSVFAIIAMARGISTTHNLFDIVFMVSLFSVAVQGTLLPKIACWLGTVDDSQDVRKTFNDYQEESAITLMRLYIPPGHNWENRPIREVSMPTGSLALMIKRGGRTLVTKGDTVILAGDSVILSVPPYEPGDQEQLEEMTIEAADSWNGKTIAELHLPDGMLIALVKRGEECIIPDGSTRLQEKDIVVAYHEPAEKEKEKARV